MTTHDLWPWLFGGAIAYLLGSVPFGFLIARAKGYDDNVSACSYAGYENVFQAEAIAFGQWLANVWAYGYAELDKMIAGTRPVPTIAEILAELPALVLP